MKILLSLLVIYFLPGWSDPGGFEGTCYEYCEYWGAQCLDMRSLHALMAWRDNGRGDLIYNYHVTGPEDEGDNTMLSTRFGSRHCSDTVGYNDAIEADEFAIELCNCAISVQLEEKCFDDPEYDHMYDPEDDPSENQPQNPERMGSDKFYYMARKWLAQWHACDIGVMECVNQPWAWHKTIMHNLNSWWYVCDDGTNVPLPTYMQGPSDLPIVNYPVTAGPMPAYTIDSRRSTKCHQGWVQFGWSCYFINHETGRNFANTKTYCEGLGGNMAQIESSKENDFLLSLIGGTSGGHWLGNDDNRWTDGSDYYNFHEAWNAIADVSNLCVEMDITNGGKWTYKDCAVEQYAICEIKRGRCVDYDDCSNVCTCDIDGYGTSGCDSSMRTKEASLIDCPATCKRCGEFTNSHLYPTWVEGTEETIFPSCDSGAPAHWCSVYENDWCCNDDSGVNYMASHEPCSTHDDCSGEFCYEGTCAPCSECHYCRDGIDGTCGPCTDGPRLEEGPCGEIPVVEEEIQEPELQECAVEQYTIWYEDILVLLGEWYDCEWVNDPRCDNAGLYNQASRLLYYWYECQSDVSYDNRQTFGSSDNNGDDYRNHEALNLEQILNLING